LLAPGAEFGSMLRLPRRGADSASFGPGTFSPRNDGPLTTGPSSDAGFEVRAAVGFCGTGAEGAGEGIEGAPAARPAAGVFPTAGVAVSRLPPHMPQKRFPFEFSFPQRAQRTSPPDFNPVFHSLRYLADSLHGVRCKLHRGSFQEQYPLQYLLAPRQPESSRRDPAGTNRKAAESSFSVLVEVTVKRYLLVPMLLLTLSSLAASQVPGYAPHVRVEQSVMADDLIKRVDPIYPPTAKQARIQGAVVLKVVISKSGDVENIQMISGHPMLAPAAIEAVKQWKYRPYLLNGASVEVDTQVTVNFTLADKPADASGVAGPGFSGFIPSPQGNTAGLVPQRTHVSPSVEQGLLVTKVNPHYPQEAKDQRIQGTVVLSVIVDKEGNVANIQLISGHPLFAPAAIEAVKQWKYKPYLVNGTPLEVDTQVRVNFTLAE
jgi:TonB family protein